MDISLIDVAKSIEPYHMFSFERVIRTPGLRRTDLSTRLAPCNDRLNQIAEGVTTAMVAQEEHNLPSMPCFIHLKEGRVVPIIIKD